MSAAGCQPGFDAFGKSIKMNGLSQQGRGIRPSALIPQASPAGIIPTGGGVHESQLFHQGSADRGERRLIRRLIPDHSVPR